MTNEKRPYVQTARRKLQEETRLRIVKAIVALHQELGPKNTSITAVARRAGVERLTVYRHFEDQRAMFEACSGYWISENPLPEAREWEAIEDTGERSYAALLSIYRYFARTALMLTKIYRDLDEVEALAPIMRGFDAHFSKIADDVAGCLAKRRASSELKSIARHLVRFTTWQSLSHEGFSEKKIAQVGLKWLERVAQ